MKPRHEASVNWNPTPRQNRQVPNTNEQNLSKLHKDTYELIARNHQMMADMQQAIQLMVGEFMSMIDEKTKAVSQLTQNMQDTNTVPARVGERDHSEDLLNL